MPSRTLYVATVLLGLLITLLITATVRLLSLLPSRRSPPRPRKRGTPTRLLVMLGSGGHTAEMLTLLQSLGPSLKQDYVVRSYVLTKGDAFSAEKIAAFDSALADTTRELNGKDMEEENVQHPSGYDITIVPRARLIHQPLWTTPRTALCCLSACYDVLKRPSPVSPSSTSPCLQQQPVLNPKGYLLPDIILTNGPGSAAIMILASYILRFFDVGGCQTEGKMRTVYVESWARVKTLSLSGRLVAPFVDRFLVQWEGLVERTGRRGEYRGVLIA